MADHVVFLVHGIGGHSYQGLERPPRHAWAEPVIAAFDATWKTLPRLGARERAAHVELVPITYDHVFHDYLTRLATYARGLQPALREALGSDTVDDVLEAIGDASAEDAGFLWDTLTDLLLYRLGDGFERQVQEAIEEQIVRKVRAVLDGAGGGPPPTFSLVSHSLGTAAAHGALHRLARGTVGGSDAFSLAGGAFHLHAYVALANVSRLLWTSREDLVGTTLVRPRDQGRGYVDTFLNVAHVADPVPRPRPFAPSDWGGGYRAIALDHVHQPNVHAFEHYFGHPRVVCALVRALYGDRGCTEAEQAAVVRAVEPIVAPTQAARMQIVRARDALARRFDEAFHGDAGLLAATAGALAALIVQLVRARRALMLAGEPV